MAQAGPISPSIGASPLDGPPPSPTAMGGATSPFSPQGLAGPSPVPAGQVPPEILTGLMQSAQQIGSMLDTYAQVVPDKAAKFGMIKDLLQSVLAEITAAGAGPVSPTAPGPAAPMGGMDRGISGPGSV